MSSYIYILSISDIGQAEPCCDKDVSAQLTSTHHKPGGQAAKMAGSMASKPMHQTIPHGTLCGTTKWLWFLQVRNRSTQQWYSDSIGRKDPQDSAICVNVNGCGPYSVWLDKPLHPHLQNQHPLYDPLSYRGISGPPWALCCGLFEGLRHFKTRWWGCLISTLAWFSMVFWCSKSNGFK